MDFTATNPDFVLDKKLLGKIVALVNQRTGIPLFIQTLNQLRYNDKPTGFAAIVKFWGADHPRNQAPPPPQRWLTSVKIEIILYEQMVFEPELRPVHHGYSDNLSEATAAGVPCYSINEVLAEKLRALIQRSYTAPRDFYDIWYLSQNVPDLDWMAIKEAFYKKMKFKNIEFTGIGQMINPENDKQLKAAWNNSLAHQIPGEIFPDYEIVRDEIKQLLTQYFIE